MIRLKADEADAQSVSGQGFGPAAELSIGAELHASARTTGDPGGRWSCPPRLQQG
jgi:hypothetical protein